MITPRTTSEPATRRRGLRWWAVAPFLLLSWPLAAAVITVDGFDSTTAEDGICTLREAIMAANSDLATGGCAAGSGADTILLTGDVTLTVEDSFQTGTPQVISRITVRGDGYTIERSAAAGTAEFRILYVAPAGQLNLKETTISGGHAPLSENGGGIYNDGRLTLTNSFLFANTAQSVGGGIYSGPGSTLRMVGGGLVSNTAIVFGGAIASYGVATLIDTTVALNDSAFGGGALLNLNGEMSLVGTAVWVNDPAGVEAQGGVVRATNSTISGHPGVGISVGAGTVILVHSTVAGNTSAVSNRNLASVVILTGSVIADSAGDNCSGPGVVTDAGDSLADDATCGDVPVVTPAQLKLDPSLADNGGPTLTHALLAGSGAIDGAGDCDQPGDQRGALREGACDIGAYESGADDQYETAGEGGGDDTCSGHRTELGRSEGHLHTADWFDWIWFRPSVGSTYEIETSSLIGGSDTVLELWRDCATKLDENDDIDGTTLASKITHTATVADTNGLDVLVRDLYGAGTNRGYDVTVACLSGPCTGCGLGGGAVFTLSEETIVTHREIEACDSIVATDSIVEYGARATLRAGSWVELGNGFAVLHGGEIVVELDPDLQ